MRPTSRSSARRRVAAALDRFRAAGEPYKVELIEDLISDEGTEEVSLYRNGPFLDLCRGPHGPSTGRIEAIKLNSLAGAYWRGDETRQMLTRIYGTAFFSQKDLDAHLEQLELARANDHRKLGPELGLFRLRSEAPGMARHARGLGAKPEEAQLGTELGDDRLARASSSCSRCASRGWFEKNAVP